MTYMLRATMSDGKKLILTETGAPVEFDTFDEALGVARQLFKGEGFLGDLPDGYEEDFKVKNIQLLKVDAVSVFEDGD